MTSDNSLAMYQGDSSDIIAIRVYSAGVQVMDLDGYEGVLSICTLTDGTSVLEKELVIVDDEFRIQIAPDESATLAVGAYNCVVEVKNDTLSYKKEYHLPLTIKRQGFIS
jgi:hypothetical protein